MAHRWKTPLVAAVGMLCGTFVGLVPALTGDVAMSLGWTVVVVGLGLVSAVGAAAIAAVRNMFAH